MKQKELKEYMDRVFNGLEDRKNEIDNTLKILKGININILDKTNDYLLVNLLIAVDALGEVLDDMNLVIEEIDKEYAIIGKN